jgi:hypothetical protein
MTEKIKLSRGEYKLTKFILLRASDTAEYAIPRSNSARAADFSNLLPVNFTVAPRVVNDASLLALKILETESAADYGYAKDDFGFQSFLSLSLS